MSTLIFIAVLFMYVVLNYRCYKDSRTTTQLINECYAYSLIEEDDNNFSILEDIYED